MFGRIDESLRRAFEIREEEGSSKITTLPEAVRRNVKPKMILHFTSTHSSASAAMYEVIRQFWDRDPQFTLVGGVSGIRLNLIHLNMLKKAICSFAGDSFPMPGPNPIVQRAYKERKVEFENWTMNTIPRRLMAAALGIGFMPTRSIVGSSLAEANKDSFREMEDPFRPGKRLGLIRALHPDISFIHGWAADSYGNTILVPPLGEHCWGAMAARNGAIVSVERIVSTQFIREHSSFVHLPGYAVNSVCLVPFGAHPGGLTNHGVKDLEGYGEDYDFMIEHRKATRNPEALDAWIRNWILDCPSHDEYLRKLGHERLLYLRGRIFESSWEREFESLETRVSPSEECTPVEMMAVVGGRKIKEKVLQKGYKTILAGVGVSNLSAWLAYYDLKNEGYEIDLAAEIGFYGYAPRPGDPWIFSLHNIPTCKVVTDIGDVLGLYIGGENNRALGALGGAQIDKHGNINATMIPGKLFFTGSGGSNDVASAAQEVVVTLHQSKDRYLDRVPYITSPGNRIRTLVSTMGVFENIGEDKEFSLTGCFPDPHLKTMEAKVERIKAHCGWELKVASGIQEIPPPSASELTRLRTFDPNGYYLT